MGIDYKKYLPIILVGTLELIWLLVASLVKDVKKDTSN